ncbi:MAG: Hsp20/alpha crystallin family protein [Candidatus Eremiobacteraeota bacterium]|nr:Hsp20/alpha crystallin family protein [Candidatus Eremiobacteraeota bacterium]MBC5801980.1 Hsp20/alpha crystallin family protein [Candidatus Eremiobacteraeota bacterium]MBC5820482.1 Hsp20/alpha crystallin family protein [Candidatus Eremiobacteraeota bacterium]
MTDDFFAEFDAMFAELARRSRPGQFEPNADLYLSVDGSTMLVDVEIAGAEPADLRVMVEARRLYIVGRRYDRERDLRGSVLLKEIAYGDFAKKVHLPVPVAYDEATASYRDGILTIRLPVSERAALPQHRTEIRMTVRRVPA